MIRQLANQGSGCRTSNAIYKISVRPSNKFERNYRCLSGILTNSMLMDDDVYMKLGTSDDEVDKARVAELEQELQNQRRQIETLQALSTEGAQRAYKLKGMVEMVKAIYEDVSTSFSLKQSIFVSGALAVCDRMQDRDSVSQDEYDEYMLGLKAGLTEPTSDVEVEVIRLVPEEEEEAEATASGAEVGIAADTQVENSSSTADFFIRESDDYYDRLGVSRDATSHDIKKAFRKISLKVHPDKGGDSQQFALLSEAYDTLIDEESRTKYDWFTDSFFYGANMSGPSAGPRSNDSAASSDQPPVARSNTTGANAAAARSNTTTGANAAASSSAAPSFHKRPRGRAPANCIWDSIEGKWMPAETTPQKKKKVSY